MVSIASVFRPSSKYICLKTRICRKVFYLFSCFWLTEVIYNIYNFCIFLFTFQRANSYWSGGSTISPLHRHSAFYKFFLSISFNFSLKIHKYSEQNSWFLPSQDCFQIDCNRKWSVALRILTYFEYFHWFPTLSLNPSSRCHNSKVNAETSPRALPFCVWKCFLKIHG